MRKICANRTSWAIDDNYAMKTLRGVLEDSFVLIRIALVALIDYACTALSAFVASVCSRQHESASGAFNFRCSSIAGVPVRDLRSSALASIAVLWFDDPESVSYFEIQLEFVCDKEAHRNVRPDYRHC